MELQGVVTTGLGKGAHYIGMDEYQDLFHNTLGFYPFPGTLNLTVDREQRTAFTDSITPQHREAPYHEGNRMSAVEIYPVEINGIACALLDLEKTDHPDSVAEIIAPINLREEFDLEDGDTVIVRPRK